LSTGYLFREEAEKYWEELMARNGNGNRTGNGNGAVQKVWNLKKDGILWKKVSEHSPQAFQESASAFVVQLQDSVRPADALQGLLLDRIAASYLRKQLLLEMEAMARLSKRLKSAGRLYRRPNCRNRLRFASASHCRASLLPMC
jgi:hypothetical protein